MPFLELSPDDALYYEWTPPSREGAASFVFVNPITGDVSLWNDFIVPALIKEGFGALTYNFRGQAQSRYAPDTALNDVLITSDLIALIKNVDPPRMVLAGLSIGGLYAARAFFAGVPVHGMVLMNTLRRITPRIAWMNDATLRVMQVGGPNLMKDLYFHLLLGEDFTGPQREKFLLDSPDYQPLSSDSGAYNLLTWMGASDWNVDWSKLALPVLVITGLQDRVFYDAAIVAELYEQLPDAQRVDIPSAGHMLPQEAPAELSAALLNFARTL
jgi:3-oxoadipate enol-lactonase